MKALVQRVRRAKVSVDGDVLAEIDAGLLVFLGVGVDDSASDAQYIAKKTCKLRVFDDGEGVMNLSVSAVEGEILVISQFTLMADCRRGNRPSYINAARSDQGETLYECYVAELKRLGCQVETGEFGADMLVELQNDGPVTIMLDSRPGN